MRELLKCPEITAKTLKSLEAKISTDEAFAMLQQIDVIWDLLFPIEQYRIICLLIKAMLVREDGIDVHIHYRWTAEFIATCGYGGMSMSKGALSVFVLMHLKKRGGRKMVPKGKAQLTNQNASIDTTLVKALIRAHPPS